MHLLFIILTPWLVFAVKVTSVGDISKVMNADNETEH